LLNKLLIKKVTPEIENMNRIVRRKLYRNWIRIMPYIYWKVAISITVKVTTIREVTVTAARYFPVNKIDLGIGRVKI
jgi:hypothetical protein